MNILLIYDHYVVCAGRYLTTALQNLGHTTYTAGRCFGTAIWGTHMNYRFMHTPSAPPTLDELDDLDLIIIADSDPFYLSLERLKQFGLSVKTLDATPVVTFAMDNHVRDYSFDGCDHHFVAHRSVSEMDTKRKDITHIGCGFLEDFLDPDYAALDSTKYHGPSNWHLRPYDVAFVGVPYHQRMSVIRALRQAGIKVFTFTGLIYENFAKAYRMSKISLNYSANFDLNQRFFETAALGCHVMTNALPDLQGRSDIPLDAYQVYSTPQDAVVVAEGILEVGTPPPQDTSWLQEHTWENKAMQVLGWVRRQ